MRPQITIAVLAMVCTLAARTLAAPETQPDAKTIEAILAEVRAKHSLPAMAACAVNSTEIIESAAAGVLRSDRDDKVTLEHRFHIGSCTKAMTATMIARLVDAETLAWDTTVIEMFPEIAGDIKPDYHAVSLKQLLNHTGGVAPGTAGNSPEYRLLHSLTGTPREQRYQMVAKVLAFDPVAEPGTKMVYSNLGYSIAVAMAEKAADTPWEQLMHKHIFEPLKMSNAGFGWPATKESPGQPHGHLGPTGVMEPDNPYRLLSGSAPAGDVHATIEDFARFAQAHLKALRGDESLCSKSSTAMLHEPVLSNYAMGWVQREIAGTRVQWHNGSAGTFFAWMTIFPDDDLAVVVATNIGTREPACKETTEMLFNLHTTAD